MQFANMTKTKYSSETIVQIMGVKETSKSAGEINNQLAVSKTSQGVVKVVQRVREL